MDKRNIVLNLLRLSLSWIFLWTFLDKAFGFGFATASNHAWIDGVSPTAGFLKMGTYGPLASIFQSMAGNVFVDWLFMLGMLLTGIALALAIGLRIAGISGSLMMLFIWLSELPPKQNPFMDEHIIYIIILIGISVIRPSGIFGLGKWWGNTKIVKKYPLLN